MFWTILKIVGAIVALAIIVLFVLIILALCAIVSETKCGDCANFKNCPYGQTNPEDCICEEFYDGGCRNE